MVRKSYETKFVCKYCHKSYVKEAAYLEHQCKQMKRAEEIQTPVGQTAWLYYCNWLRAKKRSPPASPHTFLESKFYRTFINFTRFSQAADLPQPDRFIKWATGKDYQPAMWCIDVVYAEYMDYLDGRLDPIEQAHLSIKTILHETDRLEVDASVFFEAVHSVDIIRLIQVRKLSPWLLLLSRKFQSFFAGLSPEQKVMVEDLVQPELWLSRLESMPQQTAKIKAYLTEMGL